MVMCFRLYDIRSNQRRPVHDLLWEDEALTSTSATGNSDQVRETVLLKSSPPYRGVQENFELSCLFLSSVHFIFVHEPKV